VESICIERIRPIGGQMSLSNSAIQARILAIMEFIGQIPRTDVGELYRNLLYFPLLDVMGSIYEPKNRGSGAKIRSLIDRFGNWQDKDRVSVVLLARLLSTLRDPSLETAQKHLTSIIDQWPPISQMIPISDDISYREAKKILGGIDKIEGYWLRQFTHKYLLWSSRNTMVHAMDLRPWEGVDIFEGKEPYYHWITPFGMRRPKLAGPIYPEGFLIQLVNECRHNLFQYCESQGISAIDNLHESKELRWPNWLASWASENTSF
jgi:hypothetical protein